MQHHRRTWTVQWYSPGARWRQCANTCFLGTTGVHNPDGISIDSAIFVQLSAECRWACPRHVFCVFPLKSCPWHGAIRIPIYVIPLAHPSPQPKRHLRLFSCFCKAHLTVSLYFTMGHSFPPSNCPFPLGSALNVIAHVFHVRI